MSSKELRDFTEKLSHGLEIAEKRMLEEKALRGQNVIVCDANNRIHRIPAKQMIENNPLFK